MIVYNNYRECKPCNMKRSLNCYYENKDKIANYQKLYLERNRDVLLTKYNLNPQNRKFERKTYEKQTEELRKN